MTIEQRLHRLSKEIEKVSIHIRTDTSSYQRYVRGAISEALLMLAKGGPCEKFAQQVASQVGRRFGIEAGVNDVDFYAPYQSSPPYTYCKAFIGIGPKIYTIVFEMPQWGAYQRDGWEAVARVDGREVARGTTPDKIADGIIRHESY